MRPKRIAEPAPLPLRAIDLRVFQTREPLARARPKRSPRAGQVDAVAVVPIVAAIAGPAAQQPCWQVCPLRSPEPPHRSRRPTCSTAHERVDFQQADSRPAVSPVVQRRRPGAACRTVAPVLLRPQPRMRRAERFVPQVFRFQADRPDRVCRTDWRAISSGLTSFFDFSCRSGTDKSVFSLYVYPAGGFP